MVSEAATVGEAVRALAQRPDWILLDLMLPDGDGTDVLRRARAAGLHSQVCIISGCAPARIEEARCMGAEHVFIKPLDVERLIGVLSER